MSLAILLLFVGSILSGCSTTAKDEDEYADWTAEQLYGEAKKALTEKSYEKAIKLYEKLEARYPFGNYATQAQIDVAYAYYKNNEPDSALAAADRFIKLNPSHPRVDYAYYLKGLINYNRGISFIDRFMPTDSSQRDPGSARDAFRDFNELLAKFPRSQYAEDARQRIMALRNNLAMYEVHVADFYMRRGAYLAAVNRCKEVIQKYQRTQAVPKALKIMEAAYRKLEMNDLAEDAARVYALNYAENAAATSQLRELSPAEKVWDFMGFDR
ncbi:MAG TPA: outer membrane protein assembly factor BamD [Methylococcaceae bacterium]|nr:outer membrane protein assembly factor BamD [Methylococcaceae bacterium]